MNPLRIHLQLIGMVILWGASWPWGRVVAQAMPTFVASSVRFFFAIIPLMIWLYAANRFKYAKQLSANQWFGLFVTAFFGVFAYSTFFIWGLKYLPAGQAAVIVATNPVFTTLLAIFLFKEKWNRWVILGMIIAMSGTLLALTKGNFLQMMDSFGFVGSFTPYWREKYSRALILSQQPHYLPFLVFYCCLLVPYAWKARTIG